MLPCTAMVSVKPGEVSARLRSELFERGVVIRSLKVGITSKARDVYVAEGRRRDIHPGC